MDEFGRLHSTCNECRENYRLIREGAQVIKSDHSNDEGMN